MNLISIYKNCWELRNLINRGFTNEMNFMSFCEGYACVNSASGDLSSRRMRMDVKRDSCNSLKLFIWEFCIAWCLSHFKIKLNPNSSPQKSKYTMKDQSNWLSNPTHVISIQKIHPNLIQFRTIHRYFPKSLLNK